MRLWKNMNSNSQPAQQEYLKNPSLGFFELMTLPPFIAVSFHMGIYPSCPALNQYQAEEARVK
jgi:hypothetical protein